MKLHPILLTFALIPLCLCACDKATEAIPSTVENPVDTTTGTVTTGRNPSFTLLGGQLKTFRFTTQANTSYLIQSTGGIGTKLELKDSAGNFLATDVGALGDQGQVEWTANSIQPVLIVVHGYAAAAPGTVVLAITKTCEPDTFESDNSMQLATELKDDGFPQQHSLTAGDVDWLKIAVVAGRTYRLSTTTYQNFELFNADSSEFSWSERFPYSFKAPKDGFVYARLMSSDPRNYSFQVTSDLDGVDRYEPDDSIAFATPLALDSTPQAHYLNKGDVDWVSLSAAINTNYILQFDSAASDDVSFAFYEIDSSGNPYQVSATQYITLTKEFTYSQSNTDSYYLRIQGAGAYILRGFPQ